MGARIMAAVTEGFTAAEAMRRIDDWFRRGYVMFSDRFTKSTHLRRLGGEDDSRPEGVKPR
jgi:hypothetical protein